MRKVSGQSLSEYAILGGLIAVVAIPALMMLGGSVSQNLGTVKPMDPMQTIVGGGDANINTVAPPVTVSQPNASPNPGNPGVISGSGWQAKYDPATGQIIYAMPQSGGGGTNTASVSGIIESLDEAAAMSRAMVPILASISDQADANGEPLPENIRVLLNQLAQHGYQMAAEEKVLVDEVTRNGIVDSNLDYLISNATDLKASNQNFSAAYEDVMQLLRSKPEYNEVAKMLNAYSGVITYTAYDHFISPAKDAIAGNEKGLVVGTQPKEVTSLEAAPVVTTTNAKAINDMGTTP